MTIIGCVPSSDDYCKIYCMATGQRMIGLSILLGVINVFRVALNRKGLMGFYLFGNQWVVTLLLSIFFAVGFIFIFSEIQRQISDQKGNIIGRNFLIGIVNVSGGVLLIINIIILWEYIFLT